MAGVLNVPVYFTSNPADRWYTIFIPPDNTGVDKSQCVKGLNKALELTKRYPGCRFQCAETYEEAKALLKNPSPLKDVQLFDISSAHQGPNFRPEELMNLAPLELPPIGVKNKGRLSLPNKLSSVKKNSVVIVSPKTNAVFVGEFKDNRFPNPKTQELTLLAREISTFKNPNVGDKIGKNPKVLINDSDRPTTVQEGCRYNALHIAAKCNNHEIVALILNSVQCYEYIQTLYPKCRRDVIVDRIQVITDAYLNTPDKMANETPLHFASKFLCVEAVRMLSRHPWCNVMATNMHKETAYDLIGTRADKKAPGFREKCQAISRLLQSMYIVPIWRDVAGLASPILGVVSHIRQLGDKMPTSIIPFFEEYFMMDLLEPCNPNLLPLKIHHYVNRLEGIDDWGIKAYAGPMSHEKAEEFLSILRTTTGRGSSSFLNSPTPSLPGMSTAACQTDLDDGYRTPPRNNCITPPGSPFPVSPMKHFNFYASTPPNSPGPKDMVIRRTDIEKGLERMVRKFAMQNGLAWLEEWKFLNFFGDICSEDGLAAMEETLVKSEKLTNRHSQTLSEDDSEKETVGEKGDCEVDDDEQENWHSAPSSLGDGDEYQDCIDDRVFLFGNTASKEDFQAFVALKDKEEIISAEVYPMLYQWFNTMKTLDEYDDFDNPRSVGPSSAKTSKSGKRVSLYDLEKAMSKLDFADA